jgi:very-short-patch-repair endonuclease
MPKKRPARPRNITTVAQLAERQHGVVAVRQLYSLGLSDRQLRHRVAGGWLHRIHRGVYAVGHRDLIGEGWWMAAVLACGEGALLSHQAAAELWKLRQRRRSGPSQIDVTVPRVAGRRRRDGIVVHRVTGLRAEEATIHHRIPVTSPARTILDLSSAIPRRQLERAIDEAERLRHCTEGDLREIARKHRGRPGSRILAAVLTEHAIGSTATRNQFEEAFLTICRKYRLPRPQLNAPLLEYVVDFFWPDAGLVIELDGRATHGTRRAFQADRERDGRLTVAGYRVVRFTWWDIARRPAIVADRVRRLLQSRDALPVI